MQLVEQNRRNDTSLVPLTLKKQNKTMGPVAE